MTLAWLGRRAMVLVGTGCVVLSAQDTKPGKGLEAADEMELLLLLNTPVTGASKREQRLIDSPQAIEVLTAEDIRTMGVYRLQDALKLMTSIDVLEADNGYSVVGMRGVMQEGQPRTVQVLVDGVPLYPAIGAALDINNLPLPLDLVERIEVVRGPSSTLYGANAVVGVVAITTRKLDKGFHGDLRGSGANAATRRWSGNLRYRNETFGVVAGYGGASLGASGYRTHQVGYSAAYPNPVTGLPTDPWVTFDGPYSDAGHQSQAYARVEGTVGASRLYASAGQSHKWLGPIGPLSRFTYRMYDIKTALVGWAHSWGSTFSTEVRMHQMQNDVTAGPSPILAMVFQDPNFNGEYRWGSTKTTQLEVQANWNPSDQLHVVMGADSRKIDVGAMKFQGFPNASKETASGGFVAVDWQASQTVTVSGGARAENESLGGSRISPRATVVWNPSKSSILRLAYLTSTRSPQVLEQNINFNFIIPGVPPAVPVQPVFQIRPNPGLKPEKTSNVELGYRVQIGAVTVDATVYQMKFHQLINQETLPPETVVVQPRPLRITPTQFRNTGDATNTGLELALTWVIQKNWTLGANLAQCSFKKDNPKPTDPIGDRFAYTPKTKANVWTRFQHGKVSGYLAFQHIGSTDVEALQVYGAPLYDTREAINQWHASLDVEVFTGARLGAYVRNGAKDFTPQGASGPDRPFYYLAARREMGATLAYRF